MVIGRISLTPRPSTRMPRSTINRRTSAASTASNASRMAARRASSPPRAWKTSSASLPTASARACFSWTVVRTWTRRSPRSRRTRSSNSRSRPWPASKGQRGLPARSTSSRCARTSRWHSRWPKAMACSMVSSSTSRAPASTIRTASSVAAMTRSSGERSCSLRVGLATNRPSTCPTRTAPTGPSNGIPLRHRAADAPFMASTSGSFSLSAEMARQITCTSLRKPLGNRGRIGRSMRREVRISCSAGRPSRLKYPPGIRPPA